MGYQSNKQHLLISINIDNRNNQTWFKSSRWIKLLLFWFTEYFRKNDWIGRIEKFNSKIYFLSLLIIIDCRLGGWRWWYDRNEISWKREKSKQVVDVYVCFVVGSLLFHHIDLLLLLCSHSNQIQKQNKIHPVVNRNCEIVEIVSRFVVTFWLIISLILSCHHHWPINSICYFNWIQCSFKTNLSTLKKHWIESLTEFAISSIIQW